VGGWLVRQVYFRTATGENWMGNRRKIHLIKTVCLGGKIVSRGWFALRHQIDNKVNVDVGDGGSADSLGVFSGPGESRKPRQQFESLSQPSGKGSLHLPLLLSGA